MAVSAEVRQGYVGQSQSDADSLCTSGTASLRGPRSQELPCLEQVPKWRTGGPVGNSAARSASCRLVVGPRP